MHNPPNCEGYCLPCEYGVPETAQPQPSLQSVIQDAAMRARQSLGFHGDGDDVPMVTMDTDTNTAAFTCEYMGRRLIVAVAPFEGATLMETWPTLSPELKAIFDREFPKHREGLAYLERR